MGEQHKMKGGKEREESGGTEIYSLTTVTLLGLSLLLLLTVFNGFNKKSDLYTGYI